jgi:hypothetical protein
LLGVSHLRGQSPPRPLQYGEGRGHAREDANERRQQLRVARDLRAQRRETFEVSAIGKLGELLVKPFDSKFDDGSAVKAAVKSRLVRVK